MIYSFSTLIAQAAVPAGRLVVPAWLILPWLFVLGGVLGSFLNVVVYRLPRRISLSYPGSRCPACGHAIRWHDNIPVLAWLLLGGRCRDCRTPISFRYPLVEGFVAGLFAALAWTEIVRSGAELPTFVDGEGFAALPWLRYGLHVVLLCTLLCAALIAFDVQRVPVRLFAPALVLGLLAPVWRPDLHPAPLWNPLPEVLAGGWRQGLAQVLAGGAAAVWLACLAWPAMQGGRPQRTAAVLAIVLVGLFLGWQAVAMIAALTSVVYLAATLFHGRYWNTRPAAWSMSLLSVLVPWMLLWEPVVERLPVLGAQVPLPLLAACGAVVALFSIITRLIRRGREPALATS